jgi:hypothetical protein
MLSASAIAVARIVFMTHLPSAARRRRSTSLPSCPARRKPSTRSIAHRAIAYGALCVLLAGGALARGEPQPLAFRIDEGQIVNSFVRSGDTAAHLVLKSGMKPRILVAFPAGDSGVGAWFAAQDAPVRLSLSAAPHPVLLFDGRGRALRGIEAQIAVDASALRLGRVLLSSVRVLRNYETLGTAPAEVAIAPAQVGRRLRWARDRLDGAPGYVLSIEALDGTTITPALISSHGSIHLRITAASGETALTPLAESSLLNARAAADPRSREVLAFLSYADKFLAGSWRFETYFGRDTLLSLALLAPALQAGALQSGLDSVLERLASDGEVAHEEAIGEFAILEHQQRDGRASAQPIYDYGMIDEPFLLAPVVAQWLLARSGDSAREFLAGGEGGGVRRGDALVNNFLWVIQRTREFARSGAPQDLIGLKAGHTAGEWRDSPQGLAGGRYPYDVNVVFAPAALRAIERLIGSGLLDPYASAATRAQLSLAHAQLLAWSARAAPLFTVHVPSERARAQLASYARALGVDAGPALAALGARDLEFDALALDEAGRPIPVMHSDGGFALLFAEPAVAQLERIVDTVARPFPSGLFTSVGVLVANPAAAGATIQNQFTPSAYHGAVVWSWQQAVLVAGLNRQLARTDLPSGLRARMSALRARLWRVIDAAGAMRTSELWSWSYAHGRYRIAPFGQRGSDADESDAAQLWSTVFLAIPRLN